MTQVSWTRQAALAAGLLVLGSFAYWLEYNEKPKEQAQEEQSKKLFLLKENQVQSVQLTDGGSKTFDLDCVDQAAKLCKAGDNSKWVLEAPFKIKADDTNANSLLSQLNNLSIGETIDLKDETPEKRAQLLKEYGLDLASRQASGTRRLVVQTTGGTTTLYLGLTHPIGDSIFGAVEKTPAGQKPSGKIDETRVYLVPNYFKANFDHDLTYWRDKKLFAFSSHEIVSFDLDGPKGKVSATKKDGQWTIRPDADSEALAGDGEAIDNLLTAVAYLTAKEFVSDQKTDAAAKAALKGSKLDLTLTLQKEQGTAKEAPAPLTLTFYFKKNPVKVPKAGKMPDPDKLYAMVSDADPLYQIEASSRDRIGKSLKDLRLSKLVTTMDRFSAKKLEFTGGGFGAGGFTVASADGKWVKLPGKTDVSSERVQTFLDKVSGNRIKDFLEGKAQPKAVDPVVFALGDDKNDARRKIEYWQQDGKLYAKDLLSSRDETYVVDAAIKDELAWKKDYFDKSAIPPKAAPMSPGGMVPPMRPPMPPGMGRPGDLKRLLMPHLPGQPPGAQK